MRQLLLIAGASLLAAPFSAQVVPNAGLAQTPTIYPGGARLVTLPDGGVVTFDGSTLDRYDAGGVLLATLLTFEPSVFTGCLAVNPSGTTVLLGESTIGSLTSVDLASGATLALGVVVNNFHAAFEDETKAIVSAATCGFGCGNDLIRVDVESGETTPLALLGGASGPVAIGNGGELYYATVSATYPAPLGESSVLRFEAEDLTGDRVLSEADAAVLAAGFDGASDLAYDAGCGALFFAEVGFGSGVNRIHRFDTSDNSAEVLAEGAPFNAISGLEFHAGTSDGFFYPFQPADNGFLTYVQSDFFSFTDRVQLAPARAQLSLEGPGLVGAGEVTSTLTGGPSEGMFLLVGGFTALAAPFESPFLIDGKPLLHTSLDLPTLRLAPTFAESVDGVGEYTFVNAVGATGLLTLQAVLFNTDGEYLGTSTTASF